MFFQQGGSQAASDDLLLNCLAGVRGVASKGEHIPAGTS